MRLIKFLTVVLLLVGFTSCKLFSIPGKVTAFPGLDIKIPPGTTAAFQAGYKTGCSAVLYARGNVLYRTLHDYNYDPKMMGNKDYRTGYSRGWGWCFTNVIGLNPGGGILGSSDQALYPHGQTEFNTNPSNVNSAWGGFFKTPVPDVIETGSGLDGSVNFWQTGIGGSGTALGGNPLWSGQGSSGLNFMGIW